jgi:hypothetical protein
VTVSTQPVAKAYYVSADGQPWLQFPCPTYDRNGNEIVGGSSGGSDPNSITVGGFKIEDIENDEDPDEHNLRFTYNNQIVMILNWNSYTGQSFIKSVSNVDDN